MQSMEDEQNSILLGDMSSRYGTMDPISPTKITNGGKRPLLGYHILLMMIVASHCIIIAMIILIAMTRPRELYTTTCYIDDCGTGACVYVDNGNFSEAYPYVIMDLSFVVNEQYKTVPYALCCNETYHDLSFSCNTLCNRGSLNCYYHDNGDDVTIIRPDNTNPRLDADNTIIVYTTVLVIMFLITLIS